MAALTSANIVDRVQTYMGWGDDDSDEQAQALEWLNDAYREVLKGIWYDEEGQMRHHVWSCLRPRASMTLWGGFTAQALTAGGTGNKTLTAAAASFFATMVGATITGVQTENEYTIVTYTDSTHVVVDADASGDTTFTMAPDGDNRLPSDWGGSDVLPVYDSTENNTTDLKEVTPQEMEELWRESTTEGTPKAWCFVPAPAAAAAAPLQDIRVHPPCDEDYLIQWPYRVVPVDLADGATYHVLGWEHDNMLLAFAKATAEFAKNEQHGAWWKQAQELMRGSVIFDRHLKNSANPSEGTIEEK